MRERERARGDLRDQLLQEAHDLKRLRPPHVGLRSETVGGMSTSPASRWQEASLRSRRSRRSLLLSSPRSPRSLATLAPLAASCCAGRSTMLAWRTAPAAQDALLGRAEGRRPSAPPRGGSLSVVADAVSGGAANRARQAALIMPPQHSRQGYGRAQRPVSIARLIPSSLSLSLSPQLLSRLSLSPAPQPHRHTHRASHMTRANAFRARGAQT